MDIDYILGKMLLDVDIARLKLDEEYVSNLDK